MALDDLNVFSPNVCLFKAANEKCLLHALAYRLAEANDVWGNRFSTSGAVVIGMRPLTATWRSNFKSRDCARLLGVGVAGG